MALQTPGSSIIRETMSTCPLCQEKVRADIVEKDGKVYMQKTCAVHGGYTVQLSRDAAYYKTLSDLYFTLFRRPTDYHQYFLYFTNKCNLNCPICLIDSKHRTVDEMYLDEIKDVLKRLKNKFCMLFGAEPTCREDLPEIIRLVNEYGKPPVLFTNGLKFVDSDYVSQIKKAGVGLVYLQFDGFRSSSYQVLRGRDVLDYKMKALDNLKRLDVPTVLNVTLAKGLNDDELYDIIQYALERDFIKAITIITFTNIGDAGKEFIQYSLTPEECIDTLNMQSRGRINRDYLRLCQKLMYVYNSWFEMRSCFFVHSFILFKDKNSYLTLNDIVDGARLERVVDRTVRLIKKSQILAKIYFAVGASLVLLCDLKGLRFIASLGRIVFWGLGASKSGGILMRPLVIGLTTGCDRYKFDFQVIERCGMLFAYKKGGEVKIDQSLGCHMFENDDTRCGTMRCNSK